MKYFISVLLIIIFSSAQVNSSYNPALALHMGYYSIISYQSSSTIQAWSCSYCSRYPLTDIKVFSNIVGGIQGYTGYSRSLNSIIVAFRGSSNIQNWILNIGTTRSSYSLCTGCSVHSGFYSGYNLVASQLKTNVNNLKAKYGSARLMVTGHSLGGALAILGSADLHQLYPVDSVITFGQPRIGNQAFANWYTTHLINTYRVIDYADIVTHLPPANIGFQHGSVQIWYQRGMQTYTICSAQSESCANSIATTSFSSDDHDMTNYLKLRAFQKQQTTLQKLQNFLSRINSIGQSNKDTYIIGNNNWKIEEQKNINIFFKSLQNKKQNLKFQQ